MLSEDVQDERPAVYHPSAELALKVALLAGREIVVEDDQVERLGALVRLDLLYLARADEERDIGVVERLGELPHHLHPGRARQRANSSSESSTGQAPARPESPPIRTARSGRCSVL